jgi:hypothetical protein
MERRYLYKASRTGFSGIRTHPMYGSEVMTEAVQNNPARKRYQLEAEGHIAATYYELADGVITFIHTEVPKNSKAKASDRSWSRALWIRFAPQALRSCRDVPL